MKKYFLISIIFFSNSFSQIPNEIYKKWEAKQIATVRYNVAFFEYKFEKDTVEVQIEFLNDNNVVGKIGNAELKNCKLKENRGWLGRKLNLKTDLIIRGELVGGLFQNDSIKSKKISIPFNLKNNKPKGTLFHLDGLIDLYPMMNFELN